MCKSDKAPANNKERLNVIKVCVNVNYDENKHPLMNYNKNIIWNNEITYQKYFIDVNIKFSPVENMCILYSKVFLLYGYF